MSNRLERAGRRLLTRAVVRLLPARPLPAGGLEGFHPERVLLVRHDDRIGNLVLMTPLLQGVKILWPEVETGVLIGPRFARLYQEEPAVDRLWILEKRRILRNPLLFFSFLRELRGREYDLAVDASHPHSFSLTGAALTYFSGAPVRVAYPQGQAAAFANLLVPAAAGERHESLLLAGLLTPFADPPPAPGMRLHLSEAEQAWAARLRAEFIPAAAGRLVGLHVGGRDAKRWPLAGWIEVAERLLDEPGVALLVLCGPGEVREAEAMRAALAERVHLLTEPDLREMLAAVSACDLFLAPDTGPMHVAVALGVPTVAIFRQPNADRYGPPGPPHRIVRIEGEEGAPAVVAAARDILGALG
jgi:heptosyltransferase-3